MTRKSQLIAKLVFSNLKIRWIRSGCVIRMRFEREFWIQTGVFSFGQKNVHFCETFLVFSLEKFITLKSNFTRQ